MNRHATNTRPTPTPTPTPLVRSSQGEPVDTSEYDAKIKRIEQQSKKKPKDAALSRALGEAYLERGNALKDVRQYQAALGDYRRALKYDPENREARYWSSTIISILQQMGRDVPAEGAEPTPLPMAKK